MHFKFIGIFNEESKSTIGIFILKITVSQTVNSPLTKPHVLQRRRDTNFLKESIKILEFSYQRQDGYLLQLTPQRPHKKITV